VITSDHGNIEDMSVRGHTRNPVPLIAIGPEAQAFLANARSLTDITPRVISMFR
jgi:bisphosphoglycerate-independent phosphoglycerate mutase (AlkP superfamily)